MICTRKPRLRFRFETRSLLPSTATFYVAHPLHSLLTAFIRRKAKARRPSQFDSWRITISSPLRSAHPEYPTHHDPILTSSFASPFRIVRTSRRGATAPTRHSVGGGRE